MDLSLLTLPSLSPHGSKSTVKLQPIATAENVYQRQGIVLPLSINIWDSVPTNPEITEQSLWVPQTEIDIKTALAEGYPIIAYSDEIDGVVDNVYTATLIGYDAVHRLFIARDGEQCFDISFEVILNMSITGNFWTV